MALPRGCGLLLHPTSLPGGQGIGDLGSMATAFVDLLAAAKQSLWQVLPLGPVGGSGSPYQALSSFAGNPWLISEERLVEAGLLGAQALGGDAPENGAVADFDAVAVYKDRMLRAAFAAFSDGQGDEELREGFAAFCTDEAEWLDDFALFMALRSAYGDAAWWQWPEQALIRRDEGALAAARREHAEAIRYQQFVQYLFYRQWMALKAYANQAGVRIVGDVPIYTAHDSADVWADPDVFQIDPETGEALRMAGCPPDYFAEDGQLWGNPIYRWDVLKERGYDWWLRRMRAALRTCDVLRLDHFRGFEAYWDVPAGEETARNGAWIEGPGSDFFRALQKEFGELPLIAEDLGTITPEVDALRLAWALPGMKVLQFAFCEGANQYRPHSYETNCVVYTGTHDNDTTRGWYAAEGADYAHMDAGGLAAERDLCRRYLARDGQDIHWDLIRLAWGSVADTAVAPVQDLLGLGNEARMNRPGQTGGQWRWRLCEEEFDALGGHLSYLRELTELYDRVQDGAVGGTSA